MGGLGYSGQNSGSSTVGLNPYTGGGVGVQNFNLGSAGVGGIRVPQWTWYAAAALVAFVIYKKFA